jgi:putative transposase
LASYAKKVDLIDIGHPQIPICRQAQLLGIARSTVYYKQKQNEEEIVFMNAIDRIYTDRPYYGTRRIRYQLRKEGYDIGRKKIRRLMKKMGIEALYPKPRTSIANKEHLKYPYLLRGVAIVSINQVWSTDITYIRLKVGWIYLVAVIDWFSRYVISWGLSITLEKDFCIHCLKQSLQQGKPNIFNSDQGSQFTSPDYTIILEASHIQISMDGRGRCHDNIFVERLWRSVKYEEVYLKEYQTVEEAQINLKKYFDFYNNDRPHQSLNYQTPAEVFCK